MFSSAARRGFFFFHHNFFLKIREIHPRACHIFFHEDTLNRSPAAMPVSIFQSMHAKEPPHWFCPDPSKERDHPPSTNPLLPGVDDELYNTKFSTVPRADVATVCLEALLTEEAKSRSAQTASPPLRAGWTDRPASRSVQLGTRFRPLRYHSTG